MTNNEKLFRQKVEKLAKVYVAKNKDYGDSFTRSLDKYGILASLIRMGDKMNRIDSLYDKPSSEVDESLVDSLEDLANYAIMTAIWLENQVEGEVDYTDSTFYVSDDPYFTIRKYSDGRTENITYFDDDDYEDDFDDFDDYVMAYGLDGLSDEGYDDNYDGDYDGDCDHDTLLDMLDLDSEDDEPEDDTDNESWFDGDTYYLGGKPIFTIKRYPTGRGGTQPRDFQHWLTSMYYENKHDHDDDHDYDDSIDAFLYMLSKIDSEDNESEDDTDDFNMDGLPKFRIVRRPRGTMGNKDFINYLDLIRYLYDEEGD